MPATFQERYDGARPTYTRVNEKRFADLDAGTTVLIPSPQDIESVIDDVAAGETIDLTALRNELARRHAADGTCPVMCGMNLRIAAEVNLDALDAGVPADQVTPVWRAIDPAGGLAAKLPGGPSRIEALVEGDG